MEKKFRFESGRTRSLVQQMSSKLAVAIEDTRKDIRKSLKMKIIAMMTKYVMMDFAGRLHEVVQDEELESLLIKALRHIPVGNAVFLCFAPFVRKMVEPKLSRMSDDDLLALRASWEDALSK